LAILTGLIEESEAIPVEENLIECRLSVKVHA
jgi:hypothetical protein